MTTSPRSPLTALGVLSLVLALGFSACLKVPYTGRKQAILLSFDQEVALGADAYVEILKEEKVVQAGALREQVLGVARSVSRKTPQPFNGLAWEFSLLESEAVNAFALPGGKVAVYTGILPVLANEAGLASVMGHEVGHVVARHSAERISGALLLQLGLGAADIGLSNSGLHDELMGLLGLGVTVGAVLPFSRANELEADYLGGIFMAKAGFDPRESWAVWERMTALGGDNPIAIFSTHPSNGKRIERLKEELPTFERYYKMAKTKHGRGADLRIADAGPSPAQGPANPANAPSGETGSSTNGRTKGSK